VLDFAFFGIGGRDDDIYAAARKQLGLKIGAKKTMVDVMVIDAASQPVAN